MPAESARSAAQKPDTTPLRATLAVTPDENATCPVVSATPNATAIRRSISANDVCHSEVTVAENDGHERRYVTEEIHEACICEQLSQFDCVFDVECIQDGSLQVFLVVKDRSLLSHIIDALEMLDATVRLRRLSRVPSDEETTLEIDTGDVTEKQREAVELAVKRGYYGQPREATLEDLADELEISKSAVSQRLNAVEKTLIRSFSQQ
ncbi:helix-turn-helix domain-containing protein [Natronobacterium gregoryi]|uniref:Bacterio-opsin activator n=2 Tax=Natronobacterium gregoryi TaxID=44930 RepID=L0AM64_NATGS|nr:helix-turn-helix domain-containing protein [Natronobacterium gregoryi]AFZ74272.1 putative DNA binding protein [Natronobacterium gregoryi SP2]ELY63730.1 DNA binding protein [Natronobacterium gregoryi SP2]PLK21945.1 bacterio-opsin activator [Natronobacterium gregoryi SP2]SFI52752.1 hypothetical protein SAMN05443661_101160 [Natronobacterium gregoryi]